MFEAICWSEWGGRTKRSAEFERAASLTRNERERCLLLERRNALGRVTIRSTGRDPKTSGPLRLSLRRRVPGTSPANELVRDKLHVPRHAVDELRIGGSPGQLGQNFHTTVAVGTELIIGPTLEVDVILEGPRYRLGTFPQATYFGLMITSKASAHVAFTLRWVHSASDPEVSVRRHRMPRERRRPVDRWAFFSYRTGNSRAGAPPSGPDGPGSATRSLPGPFIDPHAMPQQEDAVRAGWNSTGSGEVRRVQ